MLPTLLLLQPVDAAARPPERGGTGRREGCWQLPAVVCSRLEAALESWLLRLLPMPRRQPAAEEQQAAAGMKCVLCWMLTLCSLWLLCSSVAPLYGDGSHAELRDGA